MSAETIEGVVLVGGLVSLLLAGLAGLVVGALDDE